MDNSNIIIANAWIMGSWILLALDKTFLGISALIVALSWIILYQTQAKRYIEFEQKEDKIRNKRGKRK